MTDKPPPVARALAEAGVPHRVFRHPGPLRSLEQAARERGQKPSQVVRSLLFRVEEGSYVMVLVTGPEQLSWPALRDHLGTSRMTTASREEVKEVTGYEIGAVAPFGLKQPVRTLVDRSVLSQETISMGSGERGVAVILRARDLMAALDEAEVGTFR